MPGKTQSSGSAIANDVARAGSNVTQRARESAPSTTNVANNTIDSSRPAAVDGLDSAASAIHDAADALPGGESVRNFAHAAADRLDSGVDYVRTRDAKQIVADAQSFIKNNPAPALIVAAVFGFIVGRALARD